MIFVLLLFFTVLLPFNISADYNDDTIKTYEEYCQKYIDTTPHEVSGGYKDWTDTALSCVSKKAEIFEVGSGFGRDAMYIKSLGYNLQTSDTTISFLKVLKDKKLKPIKFNILKDYFTKRYDMIFANSVLLHFKKYDLYKALVKIKTSLKEGGILAFSVKFGDGDKWSSEKIGAPRYYFYWQPDSIKKLVKKFGFQLLYLKKDSDAKKIFVIVKKKI